VLLSQSLFFELTVNCCFGFLVWMCLEATKTDELSFFKPIVKSYFLLLNKAYGSDVS